MHRTSRLTLPALLLLVGFASVACHTPMYTWGDYETSVLALENGFEDSNLLDEITALEEDVEWNLQKDRRPPPGLHAHLGYLHYLAGNSDAALRHFQAEKSIYPQGAVFMNGLIGRL